MNVILCPVHIERGTLQFSKNAAHIGKHLFPPFRTDVRQPIFCTENDVRQEVGVSVPHCGNLREGARRVYIQDKKIFRPKGPREAWTQQSTAFSRGYPLTPLRGYQTPPP